jgi:hypothetical protein
VPGGVFGDDLVQFRLDRQKTSYFQGELRFTFSPLRGVLNYDHLGYMVYTVAINPCVCSQQFRAMSFDFRASG